MTTHSLSHQSTLEQQLVDVEQRFTSHETTAGQVDAMTLIRQACAAAAGEVVLRVPRGREQSTALTKLEEAMFHANAGVARHGVAVHASPAPAAPPPAVPT